MPAHCLEPLRRRLTPAQRRRRQDRIARRVQRGVRPSQVIAIPCVGPGYLVVYPPQAPRLQRFLNLLLPGRVRRSLGPAAEGAAR